MHRILILFFLFVVCGSLFAQIVERETETSAELGAHFKATVNYKPIKGLKLSIDEKIELRDNITNFKRFNTRAQIEYNVIKYFELGLGYNFLASYKDGKKSTNYESYWDFRHRVFLKAAAKYKYDRFSFSLREKFRTTFRTDEYNPNEKLFAEMVLATRVKAQYKFFSKPLKTYLSVEMFNPLNKVEYQDNWINKLEYQLGFVWRLDKFNALEFFYVFEQGFNQDIDYKSSNTRVVITTQLKYDHVIGVAYSYTF